MSHWHRIWYRDVDRSRVRLLTFVLTVLIAVDMWSRVLRRGVAHGNGGFDVAHFAWLDAVQPLPTPELHLGTLFVAGFVAVAMAIAGPSRLGFAVLCLAQTYSWAMSRLDGFQHHYYLSIALMCVALMPHHEPSDRSKGEAWGFLLLAATTALMYGATVVTKLDTVWLSGSTMRKISGGSEVGRLVPDGLWIPLSGVVIAAEIVVAAGYAMVVVRPTARRWHIAAWLAAVALHVGIEVVGMHIGLFSFYMITMATVMFAPTPWLRPIANLVDRLHQVWGSPRDMKATVLVTLLAAIALVITGKLVEMDVPGAVASAATIAVGALAAVIVASALSSTTRPQRIAFGFTGALFAWWAVIASSSVEANLFNLRGWL